jgi:hypothetical protein
VCADGAASGLGAARASALHRHESDAVDGGSGHENRQRCREPQHRREKGTLVLDLISSPGSGKTSLIEATVRAIGRHYRIGALTGGGCHLDARLVNSP